MVQLTWKFMKGMRRKSRIERVSACVASISAAERALCRILLYREFVLGCPPLLDHSSSTHDKPYTELDDSEKFLTDTENLYSQHNNRNIGIEPDNDYIATFSQKTKARKYLSWQDCTCSL